MAGFLLQQDAVEARKNVFDDWLEQRKREAEQAARATQQTVSGAAQAVQTAVQAAPDQVAQRARTFDDWLGSRTPPPVPPPAAPAAPQPTPQPPAMPQPVAELSAPATPEAQQRASAFDDWLAQRQQQVQGAIAPAAQPTQAPSQPQANATDAVPVDRTSGRVFPVKDYHGQVDLHWGEVKGGADLFAPRGTPVLAMQSGSVTDAGANAVGGNTVTVQGDDGNQYYYAHLDQAPSVQSGQRVNAGTPLGAVGDSGNAQGRGTHLHIGIGPSIQAGADKFGGTGGDFDATSLLRSALEPQQTAAGVRTTAELSGGGAQGNLGDRAQQILSGAADVARPFGEDAIKAVQSVLVTEGGLNNARGDSGQSAGPLQFFSGGPGRPGQLDNFAQAFGMGVEAAKKWVEDNPVAAVRWALGTPEQPGYLGQALLAGQQVGRTGADLATWIQANGQRSVSPERAGDNFRNLFGQGQTAVTGAAQTGLDTLTRASGDVASRAQQLAEDSTRLARDSADRAQAAMELLGQTRDRIGAENERYSTARREDINRQLGDIMAPRPAPVTMGPNQAIDQGPGFRAPDLSGMGDLLGGAGRAIGQQVVNAPLPMIGNQSLAQMGRTLTTPPDLQTLRTMLEAGESEQRRQQTEGFASQAARFGAGLVGQQLSPQAEQFVRAVTPDVVRGAQSDPGGVVSAMLKSGGLQTTLPLPGLGDVPLADVIGLAVNFGVPTGAEARFGEGALRTGLTELSRLGRPSQQFGAALAVEQGVPRLIRGAADATRAANNAVARWATSSVEDIARDLARSPVGDLLRSESGELNIDALMGAAGAIKQHMVRMYHGTGAAFDRPEAGRFDEAGLFGPGYYLTSEPRVAGGLVATGGEQVGPSWLASSVKRAPGEVVSEGYAQGTMVSDAVRAQLEREGTRLSEDLARARLDPTGAGAQERIAHLEDSIAYNQARLDRGATTVPNVRAVDVPQNMNLLDADRYVHAEDVVAIRGALPANRVETFDRQVARAFEGRPTGQQVFDALTATFGRGAGAKTATNRVLAEAGFDGITYAGGKRIPMTDEAGRNIEHQATVVFPEALDKIRNAISGRQGGQANPVLAARLGGAAVGGAAGYATAPESATPEQRAARAGLGAGIGLGGPLALERLGQMSPATRAQAGDVATWLRANAPAQATAGAVGQALGPQRPGERVAEWISSNLLSGAGLVWNVVNQSMHLGWQPLVRAAEGHPIEALHGLQAVVAAAPEALQRGWATLARGEPYAGVGGQQSRGLARTSVGLRANLAGDAVLRTLNEHLGGMLEAQRLIREAGATTPQAMQALIAQNAGRIADVAQREGQRSALTTGTARTPWLRDLGTLKTSLLRDSDPLKQIAGVLLHVGMPFARVPEELLYQIARNSPVVGQLIDVLQIVKAAPGDSRREATAKAALNAAMSAAVIGAALNNQIRGADDPEHPNAANIGGQWLPLTTLGTLGGRMAVTTAVIDGLRKQGTEPNSTAMDRIARAINNVGKLAEQDYPLADQIRLLYRIGTGNLTGAASGFASDVLAGVTPVSGALGTAENVLDPYARQAATSGWGDVYQPNLARIPGVANVLPTQVNMLTGEPLRRPSSGPGALLKLQNVGRADTPIAQELIRLEKKGYKLPDPKQLPKEVSVRGATIPLTETEQQQLAQSRGQEIERLLGDRITSSSWDDLTDDQKARVIARALSQAAAHNTITWRRMTPASEQSERIARGQRVLGRPTDQGGFTAPGTAA